jgi:hypothetical protein
MKPVGITQVQKPNDPVQREHCPDQKGESIGSHLGTPTATHPVARSCTTVPFPDDVSNDFGVETL